VTTRTSPSPGSAPDRFAGSPSRRCITDGSDRSEAKAAAGSLLEELTGLVRLAAGRNDLTVREGDPDSSWSFNWKSGVISVDPVSLRSLAPDLCRGLALHEASHAAVTVLQDLVSRAELTRLMPLLNAIEDIRIETWMRGRFPGAVPWIRAYNDVFYGALRASSLPASHQMQFLRGVLELWWYGTPTRGMHLPVMQALDHSREPIAAAVACQPPLNGEPSGVRRSQQAMWDIVRSRIVPVWRRLVRLDRESGIASLAAAELAALMEASALGSLTAGGEGEPVRSLPQRHNADTDAYLAAWKRIGPSADRIADQLLRILTPRRRLRWSSGHPSGHRLDLRQAVRFEADPSLYHSLWARPILPHHRDPAVILLLDCSFSMHGDRIAGAFDGMVLLVEVCRRIGVAAAVWTFARGCQEQLGWETSLERAERHRLGSLRDSCRGPTAMAPALDSVRRAFRTRQADPKLLFVLSDGEPDHHEATRAAVRQLEAEGVGMIGLGLGPDTAGLSRYFRQAATGLEPAHLATHLGSLLEATLLHMHGLPPAAQEAGWPANP